MAFPTNPTSGQRHQEPSGIWYTWKACATGGAWEQDRSQLTYYDPIPLGAIQAFTIGTAPKGWLLCDGSTYDKTTYPELFAVLGVATLPDLRGEFLRGRKAGQTLGTHADWITGKPKTAFTGSTNSAGDHKHEQGYYTTNTGYYRYGHRYTGTSGSVSSNEGNSYPRDLPYTSTNGAHTHNVTINGGGDAETAPDHTLVDWYIKAAHAKVTLPQSGFLTAATTLHDGDVWQFEAVSNTFKNVPAATLISGMTVGTTAPTAPFTGQQYYKTDGFTPGLRVWTGTSWAFSSGGNVRNNGARIVVPGYFNQDPSDTATPGDDIGVAARYYASRVRLFAQRAGAWHPLTPEVGVASNAGKIVVADANGDPTWGPAQGLVHVANIGSAVYNTETENIIGSTNFTFKAGRYYRVTGHVKVHIDNNAWTHLRVEVTNAGLCRQSHLISGEDRFDEADHFLPAVGEVFSLTADATRKLELKVTNRRSVTLYYSWNGGSQISVEDLGPV